MLHTYVDPLTPTNRITPGDKIALVSTECLSDVSCRSTALPSVECDGVISLEIPARVKPGRYLLALCNGGNELRVCRR